MSDNDNPVIEPAAFTRAEAPGRAPLLAPSPLKLAVLALFIVLSLITLFMFNARAVKLTFDPDIATFSFESGFPTYQLGERYLMLQGEYQLLGEAPGYYPGQITVEVTDEPDQAYQFSLEKLPGILAVEASYNNEPVVGASVTVDQEPRGSTPLTIDEVAAGLRELHISHPRFLTYQSELVIEGMRQTQSVSADLSPAWAEVGITSVPAGAEILIDDETVGASPMKVEMLQGSRSVKLRLAGYKTWEALIDVVAEEAQTLEPVILVKSDGKLTITSEPEGVNITVSGNYYGQTPLSVALSPADSYELLATKAGFENIRRQFSIKADEDQSLRLQLKPVVGVVRLQVEPAGATLFVDGRRIGDPNRTLELPARAHRLKIELPGHASYESSVTPQPGFPQQLNIVMLTEEAARVSAIPQQITTSLGDTLRFIIPGDLKMGADRREPGRRSNEIEKDVSLTRAFYFGVTEISNRSFKAFSPGHDSGMLGRALLGDPDRPVVNVSWEEAVRFCNWLSQKDGLNVAYVQNEGKWQLVEPYTTGYRLPTEAEWVWAARYATGSRGPRFPWGESMPPPPGAGNFADESATGMVPYVIKGYNDKYRGPAPSGTYDANPLGIFDLAGNVSEWVQDRYSVDLERERLTDPVGPQVGDYRVIRGSNYTHGRFSELRWTFRDYGLDARADVGFRVARWAEAQ